MTPSFLPTPRPRSGNGPGYIILDTATAFAHLQKEVGRMPSFSWDARDIAQYVFNYLAYEGKAQNELEMGSVEMVQRALGQAYEHDTVKVANALVQLGVEMHRQLQMFKAYDPNGYLFYHFRSMLGSDVLLMRFSECDIPEISHLAKPKPTFRRFPAASLRQSYAQVPTETHPAYR
jgi:hypothetical protein